MSVTASRTTASLVATIGSTEEDAGAKGVDGVIVEKADATFTRTTGGGRLAETIALSVSPGIEFACVVAA